MRTKGRLDDIMRSGELPGTVLRQAILPNKVRGWAIYSPCEQYRYVLGRTWDSILPSRTLTVIGLNPSTATEAAEDPTIRRCIQLARRLECTTYIMLNIFAYRATEPEDMKKVADPVGPQNDDALLAATEGTPDRIVVCAWGNHGGYRARGPEVHYKLAQAGRVLHHLGLTGEGFPKHPLYLPKTTPLVVW